MSYNVSMLGKGGGDAGGGVTKPMFVGGDPMSAGAASASGLGKGAVAGDTAKQILDQDKIMQALEAIKKASSKSGGMMGQGKGGGGDSSMAAAGMGDGGASMMGTGGF